MCDMTHSYVWHDSFICVTWLIRMCVMTHSHVLHDSFICVTWLIDVRDMTRWCVWHDSCIRVTWLVSHQRVSAPASAILMCVTRLIHMQAMTHFPGKSHWLLLYSNIKKVWMIRTHFFVMASTILQSHVSMSHISMCSVTYCTGFYYIAVCDITHWYVWQNSLICVTCLIHICDMIHPYVWHDSFIRVT